MRTEIVIIPRQEVLDAAMKNLLETTDYVNEDGSLYRPEVLPIIGDEHDDDE